MQETAREQRSEWR